MDSVLSIEEVAAQTGLEESLLRFYESEYPDRLPPKVLRGDVLYFDETAVAAFRAVHASHGHAGPREEEAQPARFARVIAVTSGKGGVGKTNIALNLAIELQRLKRMCVVVDADMGLANIHLLAGLRPARSIASFLKGEASISELVTAGPEGIGILPGGGGILALADSTPGERLRLIRGLAELEAAADIVLVDTGAGMGRAVREFLQAADEVIFILTPDITSLADAYGLLKALCREQRDFAGHRLYSVVNMADNLKQAADTAVRFAKCARQFLEARVQHLGYVLRDPLVTAAGVRGRPYTVLRPDGRASKNTRNLALGLLEREEIGIRTTSAFRRYMKLMAERG